MDLSGYKFIVSADEQGRFQLIPQDAAGEAAFELAVSIEESGLNVRDLSAYLGFIDRVYGRLVSQELRSYAQLPTEQIEVMEIKSGSWEMIFQEILINADKVSAAVILGLILKYLPDVIQSLAGAYKDIQEAHLIQLQRQKLIKELEKEAGLEQLNTSEREQLAAQIESIYRIEQRSLPAAGRFASKYVKAIRMQILKQQDQ